MLSVPGEVHVGMLLAQTVLAQPATDPDLDRIRKLLAKTPAISLPATRPVFRVTVHGFKSDVPVWAERSPFPSYVRTPFPSYHWDYLNHVTPEAFRAGLYTGGIGIPIGTIVEAIAKHIKAARRKTKEGRAREEVRQALAELFACRADPTRPGC